ncbi:Hypothetical protein FKW44_016732 [Caligus rogercresseyi]|uniref:Uncharacterized protein n=1 Tax=Caligus rogercresseyi TaxID=217165 RepID=A0A7T8H2K4_CALRO|nr:Hypothetical protein FKW44_016732 [Caligus rogercresseyi]
MINDDPSVPCRPLRLLLVGRPERDITSVLTTLWILESCHHLGSGQSCRGNRWIMPLGGPGTVWRLLL